MVGSLLQVANPVGDAKETAWRPLWQPPALARPEVAVVPARFTATGVTASSGSRTEAFRNNWPPCCMPRNARRHTTLLWKIENVKRHRPG